MGKNAVCKECKELKQDMLERESLLTDIIYSLAGDLSQSGALPEWKRNRLWKEIEQLRESNS